MDDYSALAQRVAVTVGDVRGCLVLSRDGLVLGAYPEDESAIKPAWLKFATLGEPQRSFVEFGDQIWAYVHRGPYAAFIVAGASVRPGLLIDQMEQALLAAEDARTRREPLKLPDATGAPSGKPRTSLHPSAERQQPAEVMAGPSDEDRRKWARATPTDGDAAGDVPAGGEGDSGGDDPAGGEGDLAETRTDAGGSDAESAGTHAPADAPEPASGAPASGLRREPQQLVGSGGAGAEGEDGEIDRVLLAKEFSGLLQPDSDGDEDSS